MDSKLTRENLWNALDQTNWADMYLGNACDALQKASLSIPAKSSWWSKMDNAIYDLAVIEEKLRQIKEDLQDALDSRR